MTTTKLIERGATAGSWEALCKEAWLAFDDQCVAAGCLECAPLAGLALFARLMAIAARQS